MGGKPIKIGETSGCLVVRSFGPRALDRKVPGTFVLHCFCEKCQTAVDVFNTDFRRRKMCQTCSGVRGANLRTKHGGSIRGVKNDLYGAWQQMNNRCNNPKSDAYRWYGAKGIKVCLEWRDFGVFRDWAMVHGYGPGMTLDRIDETKGYHPDNCQYLTKPENSRRMRAQYVYVKRNASPAVVYAYAYDDPCYGDF